MKVGVRGAVCGVLWALLGCCVGGTAAGQEAPGVAATAPAPAEAPQRTRPQATYSPLQAGQDAYQIASQMTWDIECDTWGDFPLMQKWFATGEALAHLKYLEHKGSIQAEVRDERVTFSLPKAI